jgi:ATP-binding cassette subfamily B protein RaxB
MGIVALGMMFIYSVELTAVVVCSAIIYGLMRWAAFRPFRDTAAERLIADAKESTNFLETLRAITPIKLFGREQERRTRWQN